MSEKDIKKLTDLAKKRIKEGVTKEEALKTFVMAGILNSKGEFTRPYKHLATAVDKHQ